MRWCGTRTRDRGALCGHLGSARGDHKVRVRVGVGVGVRVGVRVRVKVRGRVRIRGKVRIRVGCGNLGAISTSTSFISGVISLSGTLRHSGQ